MVLLLCSSMSVRPYCVLDVFLHLLCVRSAVYEDFFHACIVQEFEGVFYERGVGEREEALHQVLGRRSWILCTSLRTRGLSRVKGLKRVSKESARIYKY